MREVYRADDIRVVDEDRNAELDRVCANVHYQIAKNFSEKDAEATIRALVEEYPGMVMKILSKKYIKHLATLEALSTLMNSWTEEGGLS